MASAYINIWKYILKIMLFSDKVVINQLVKSLNKTKK